MGHPGIPPPPPPTPSRMELRMHSPTVFVRMEGPGTALSRCRGAQLRSGCSRSQRREGGQRGGMENLG